MNHKTKLWSHWSNGLAMLMAMAIVADCHQPRGSYGYIPEEGEELPILALIQESHSHESSPMHVVIRDEASYNRIPLKEISVDFEREMLLIVTLGRVMSDQYSVSIDRVWREGHELQAATTIRRPAPGAPPVLASPYCIAKVPRCDLNVAGFLPEPPARTRTWGPSEYGFESAPIADPQ